MPKKSAKVVLTWWNDSLSAAKDFVVNLQGLSCSSLIPKNLLTSFKQLLAPNLCHCYRYKHHPLWLTNYQNNAINTSVDRFLSSSRE